VVLSKRELKSLTTNVFSMSMRPIKLLSKGLLTQETVMNKMQDAILLLSVFFKNKTDCTYSARNEKQVAIR
jgi:hypothetical protein